jgi:hypothetical protein
VEQVIVTVLELMEMEFPSSTDGELLLTVLNSKNKAGGDLLVVYFNSV